MTLSDVERIHDTADFAAFLGGLAENFRDRPDEWQCETIDQFLEAIAAWVMDFSVRSQGVDLTDSDLKALAKMFYMGKFYE